MSKMSLLNVLTSALYRRNPMRNRDIYMDTYFIVNTIMAYIELPIMLQLEQVLREPGTWFARIPRDISNEVWEYANILGEVTGYNHRIGEVYIPQCWESIWSGTHVLMDAGSRKIVGERIYRRGDFIRMDIAGLIEQEYRHGYRHGIHQHSDFGHIETSYSLHGVYLGTDSRRRGAYRYCNIFTGIVSDWIPGEFLADGRSRCFVRAV